MQAGRNRRIKTMAATIKLKAKEYVKRYSHVDSRRDKIPKGEGEGRLQRESKYKRSYSILRDVRLLATTLIAD